MKLSEKGVDKLYAQVWINQEDLPQDKIFEFESLKFDQDDFNDCIVLSVKEIKDIASKLGYLAALTTNQEIENDALELQYLLLNRIEQGERK